MNTKDWLRLETEAGKQEENIEIIISESTWRKDNFLSQTCRTSHMENKSWPVIRQYCLTKNAWQGWKIGSWNSVGRSIYVDMDEVVRTSWENCHDFLFRVGVTVNFEDERTANPHTERYFCVKKCKFEDYFRMYDLFTGCQGPIM